MRFVDEANISVFSGHGGPGCVAFRREKYVPRGGPSGGDGGDGGSIRFVMDPQLETLQDFRFKRKYQAENGHPGMGSHKAGRKGEDCQIRVPRGTQIFDLESGDLLTELDEDRPEWIATRGGRGGKGNAHFKSSTHQAPRFAQPGLEGEGRNLKLELRLLAEVGIVGVPNAGKSTLISGISAARPKIADYAFTTMVPNLGVVYFGENESCVVADIPGLIEGAHAGAGLGHRFLKHIERTRLLVHLLDGSRLLDASTAPESEREEAVQKGIEHMIWDYMSLRSELGMYNEGLLHKPEMVVVNKLDLFEWEPEWTERLQKELRAQITSIRYEGPLPEEPLFISAAQGDGASPIKTFKNVLRREVFALRAQETHSQKSPQEVLESVLPYGH